ncbi:glycerophosphodiester phosphodiesterase [Microbacterium sediminicola]|uniref:Glycerophosphodiester phosphodiesterase n=1 Tax=Microbacterium sediminicola TaxID=415210 RepID=A0ABP4TVU3_9MICO
MTHPYFQDAPSPRILAHRGLSVGQEILENSYAAVAAARDAGALYVESDCHLTVDGEVVLFHDSDLRRVTGDPRAVAEVTAAELARLMAGRGELITLRDALRDFPRTRFNLDVKAPAAAVPVGTLVAPHAERVLLTSFSDARRHAALAAAHKAGGSPATSGGRETIVKLLAGIAVRSDRLVRSALAGIDALQLPERRGAVRIVTPRLLHVARMLSVEVHVWTVNDAAEMRRLVALGVAGIVTDRADLALATFASPTRG